MVNSTQKKYRKKDYSFFVKPVPQEILISILSPWVLVLLKQTGLAQYHTSITSGFKLKQKIILKNSTMQQVTKPFCYFPSFIIDNYFLLWKSSYSSNLLLPGSRTSLGKFTIMSKPKQVAYQKARFTVGLNSTILRQGYSPGRWEELNN